MVPEGCTLDECIVTDGVTLERNAVYCRSVLLRENGRVISMPLELQR
jgi:hypothetical protein